MKHYGYKDPALVDEPKFKGQKRITAFLFAIVFITGVWLALDQKLLFGENWISETYDHIDWRTNEGNLPTYGAWDIEAHIWKSEFIMKYFPNFQWNPYWYLGMPLLKYYQFGFYSLNIGLTLLTGVHLAKSALLLVIFGHLLATLLTFFLCYKVSGRVTVSALCSVFLLSNTFISLRSYGWEPITVVFLFLYPLGLLLFLREPLNPFRFSMVITLTIAYLTHPLLWFTLCMFMGIYLLTVSLRKDHRAREAGTGNALWWYFVLVFASMLLAGIQFIPMASYDQATSGSHMGVKYLPYYQVPYNIITMKDFFFDMGNLKGPGPIVMISFFLLLIFAMFEYKDRKIKGRHLFKHEMITSLALVLGFMVLFYYLELWNIFPMNMLRSIQYHRIIPEFIITAAVLVAALSNVIRTEKQKAIYYAMLVAFVAASGIIVHDVQNHWATIDTLENKPEMIYEDFPGRLSMAYPDQSLSVRNSFTEIPQVYGYYEQGITNAYNDEIFSVSSGFHNAELTILYLKAANVGRLYINDNEGVRDMVVKTRLNNTMGYYHTGDRYGYFMVPLKNGSFAQAVSVQEAYAVQDIRPGFRELYHEHYEGSYNEEFVSTDKAEIQYLEAYVDMMEKDNPARAAYEMVNPDFYRISVTNATPDMAVVVKMNYDEDFRATVHGKEVPIEKIGPDFMLVRPGERGDYEIELRYHMSAVMFVGAIVSATTFLLLCIFFLVKKHLKLPESMRFQKGDMR